MVEDLVAIILLIFFILIFSLFLGFSIIMGIQFDYRKGVIKSIVPILGDCKKIQMKDIKTIEFIEKSWKRKKYYFGLPFSKYSPIVDNYNMNYTYRNGRVYEVKILVKGGMEHKIFYGMLFKARSLKRVEKQEQKVKAVLAEFNEYKYETFFKNKFKQ